MSTIPPMSSLGRSVHAYQPYYAPPTFPQTNYISSRSPVQSANPPLMSMGTTGSAVVNARPRMVGMSFLYSRGARFKQWFKMIATGQVEKTAFQPLEAYTWYSAGNDALYQAGYPRNLGWSEKVPTIPREALGNERSQMNPMPQFKRNVYTRRSFSTAPSVPAQPMNGRTQ